jgi:hypothetical protein
MKTRFPALVASAAFAVIVLTGCSASAGAADLNGGRSPMLQAGGEETTADRAQTTTAPVTATSITQNAFWSNAENCESTGQVEVCQYLHSSGVGSSARVQWTTWVSVPQTTSFDIELHVSGPGTDAFDELTTVRAQGPWVKLDWESPGIPSLGELHTVVTLVLEDGNYLADCPLTSTGQGDYDMGECTPPTTTA